MNIEEIMARFDALRDRHIQTLGVEWRVSSYPGIMEAPASTWTFHSFQRFSGEKGAGAVALGSTLR